MPATQDRQQVRAASRDVRVGAEPQPRKLGEAAVGLLRFFRRFAEMWVAMLFGMAVFGWLRLGLAARGYAGLLPTGSIGSEVGMGFFMVAPMVLWMRARGCCWRDGGEMTCAMLVPWAAVLAVGRLGSPEVQAWLSIAGRTAMLFGMLAAMLYRRHLYTSG
jgi:hypothetical protein